MKNIPICILLLFILLMAARANDENTATSFVFSNDTITVTEGSYTDYTVKGTTVTISAAGTYSFSGSCNDGAIAVAKGLNGVTIVLNGLTLTNTTTAPLVVKKDTTVTITIADGTTNTLTDASYNNDDLYTDNTNAENAVIKVKSGSTAIFNGTGTLTVNANGKNGIKGGDGAILVFEDLTLNVTTTVNDGISCDNHILFKSGTYTLTTADDAIVAALDEEDTASVAALTIQGGTFTINSTSHGIKADADILITDGVFNVTAGGGYGTLDGNGNTSKAIKCDDILVIEGGTFTLNSIDDAIHCENAAKITGGSIEIYTSTTGKNGKNGGDGIHADNTLVIGSTDGDANFPVINIKKSYEALEAAKIYICSGNISMVASDDGINAANSNLSNNSSNFALNIYGGTVYVSSEGDGLDSNGATNIYGGYVEVFGSRQNDNAALDSDGTITVTGGTVCAVGYSGMAQTPSASASTQCYITFGASGGMGPGGPGSGPGGWGRPGGGGGSSSSSISISAGNTLQIKDASGNVLYNGTAVRTANHIVFTSAALKSGTTYYLYINGTQKASASATASYGSAKTPVAVATVASSIDRSVLADLGGNTGGGESGGGESGGDDDDTNQAAFTFTNDAVTKTSGSDNGYTIDGTVITITANGTYDFTGTCADGAIQVAKSLTDVVITLNGLTLTSETKGAPILIGKSTTCTINVVGNIQSMLADGTENTDKAVIKAKDGATITFDGTSTLSIDAYTKNGIKGGADGTLAFNNITIYATATVNDAISCDHQLIVNSGILNLVAGDDGLKAEPDDGDTISEGAITITGGYISIESGGDGISCLSIDISGGLFYIDSQMDGISTDFLEMTDNYMEIRAAQNGLFINGDAYVSNSLLSVAAGTDGSEYAALCYGGDFNMSSGMLLATDSNPQSAGITTADGNLESYSFSHDFAANDTVTIYQGAEATAALELAMIADGSHIIIAGDDLDAGDDIEMTQTLQPGFNAITLLFQPDDDTLAQIHAFKYEKRSYVATDTLALHQPYWIYCKEKTILTGTVKSSPYWISSNKSGWQFTPSLFTQDAANLGAQAIWQWSNGKFTQVTDTVQAGAAYWTYK